MKAIDDAENFVRDEMSYTALTTGPSARRVPLSAPRVTALRATAQALLRFLW